MDTIDKAYYKKIGLRIKKIRKEKGLTQRELADMLNCSTSYISHLERGTSKLSVRMMIHVLEALEIDSNELLVDFITIKGNPYKALEPTTIKLFDKILALNSKEYRIVNNIVDAIIHEKSV